MFKNIILSSIRLSVIAGLGLSLAFYSCTKTETVVPVSTSSTGKVFTANINGSAWTPLVITTLTSTFTKSSKLRTVFGNDMKYTLTINFPDSAQVGNFNVLDASSAIKGYSVSVTNVDYLGSGTGSYTTQSGNLNITKVDLSKLRYEGTFSMVMKPISTVSGSSAITITGGSFGVNF